MQKFLNLPLVFFGQHAACRIHQTSAGRHQRRSSLQNTALLPHQLRNAFGRLAVFQIGIAPQRAQPGTGRVHQHAVGFAGQPGNARVVFAADFFGVDIGQPRTGHARFQVRQPFFGNIECVNAAFVRHLRAHRQRFAARARAKIHHDFAALGLHQLRQKLAALVLHFQRAVQKQRVFVQCRFVAETDAVRRIRRGGGVREFGLQLGQYLVAAAFERVHARVQRCRLHHAAAER